jgi:hypothetical protein
MKIESPGGDVQVGVEHDGTGYHHTLHFNPYAGGGGAELVMIRSAWYVHRVNL